MDDLSRRTLIGGAAAIALAGHAAAQTVAGDEVVPLWPGRMPGDRGTAIIRKVNERSNRPGFNDRSVNGIDRPVLVVKRPAKPNGAAVLLMPGGGYGFLSYDNEGTEQAHWLNALGVTCFILLYRLAPYGAEGAASTVDPAVAAALIIALWFAVELRPAARG